MDYGQINSKTEHMRMLQPPPCLPCSCSAEGARFAGQIFPSLRLRCWAVLDAAQTGELGRIEGSGEGRGHEDRWTEPGSCCWALTCAHWSVQGAPGGAGWRAGKSPRPCIRCPPGLRNQHINSYIFSSNRHAMD